MNLKAKTGYYLMKASTWVIQLFPLRFHYIISDLTFPLIYHVIRYRRDVVRINLTNSFPDKSAKEIESISRKFFRNFIDSFIETLYFDRISVEEIKKRLTILNPELLENYLEEGRTVIMALGHYNNWEWNCSWPLHSKHPSYVVYKKLTNKSFNRFYYNMRARFGAIPLERADTYRQLVGDLRNNRNSVSAFLMDQTPRIHDIQYWTNFLNQDTPVITGPEKVARKLDAIVIFCHIRKLRRGYNQLEFSVVVDHAKETAQFEITEKATRKIEEVIIQQPEFWLWSHKRWKHRREVNRTRNVRAGRDLPVQEIK